MRINDGTWMEIMYVVIFYVDRHNLSRTRTSISTPLSQHLCLSLGPDSQNIYMQTPMFAPANQQVKNYVDSIKHVVVLVDTLHVLR